MMKANGNHDAAEQDLASMVGIRERRLLDDLMALTADVQYALVQCATNPRHLRPSVLERVANVAREASAARRELNQLYIQQALQDGGVDRLRAKLRAAAQAERVS